MTSAWGWVLLVALLLAVPLALWGPSLLRGWRRARIRRQPFPPAWREVLRRRMPLYRRLPPDLQWQLKKHVQVLLAEKPFIGCGGLVVTDEKRVLVAAHAALLLLNRRAGYFDNLRQILLYPGAFVVERTHIGPGGVTREARDALSGESWQQGQVILAWDAVLEGAAAPEQGRNVVIHEFAHQLDQENGAANGAPFLGRRERYARWAAVLSAEFQRLRERVARDEPGLIDAYGATDPAEFFAVISEVFFGRSAELAAEHPALHRELAAYYATNPLSW
jgi:MtfA peptidase